MMRKKNRIMAGALGLLLCVGLLCGCSNQGGNGTTASKSNAGANSNNNSNTNQPSPEHTHTYDNGICSCGARKPSEGLVYEWEDDDQDEYVLVGIGQCTDTEIVVPTTYNGKPVSEICISEDNPNATVTSVYISEGIRTINTMEGLKSLTYVYVPKSVKWISSRAFFLSTLEQIDGCEGLEYISDGSFMDCKNLKSIDLPDSVVEIANGAFVRCNSLTSFRFPTGLTSIDPCVLMECANLTEVIIPDTVTSISSRAITKCPNLTSITIPASVTTLERDVFFKSGLKDIYCEAPSQPSGWDPDWANECDATIHWGSRGNP